MKRKNRWWKRAIRSLRRDATREGPRRGARRWRRRALRLGVFALIPASLLAVVSLGASPLSAARHVEAAERTRAAARARLAYRRSLSDGEERAPLELKLAMTSLVDGDAQAAAGLLDRLAPIDAPGYAPAQRWIGRQLMARSPPGGWGGVTGRLIAHRARRHLSHAVAALPRDPDARRLLAHACGRAGATQDAVRHLSMLVSQHATPADAVELAMVELAVARGDAQRTSAARRRARVAADALRATLDATPDDPATRARLAMALGVCGRHEEAIALLSRPGLPTSWARQAVARVLVLWAEAEPPRAEELLLSAVERDPDNTDALTRLIPRAAREDPAGQRLRAALARLGGGEPPSRLALALATISMARGRFAPARPLLERAYRELPEDVGIANNLAWCLLNLVPPAPERAARICTRALARYPKVTTLLHTRATAYARLARWPDALADLQRALVLSPDAPHVHALLAEVYRQLDLPGLARQHDARAAREQ